MFELYMLKWEKLANKHSHMKPIIQEGLNWAYKYYNQMDNMKAYIVAMCKQIKSLLGLKRANFSSSKPCDMLELN